MSPRFTSAAPPFLRSSMVTAWFAPTHDRSKTRASPITWSRVISAVVMPFLKTWSGESMWAPVWRLWCTLETCQNPGPRLCGVTSSRMFVEGGLMVVESTVTERSTKRPMPSPVQGGSCAGRRGPRLASAPRVCYPSLPAKGGGVELEGKVVIVTGAAKGIGAAIVEACVREGARVAALDLAKGGVDSLASTLTG